MQCYLLLVGYFDFHLYEDIDNSFILLKYWLLKTRLVSTY